jgi:M6 family metalloprotease-like protein
MIVAHLVAAPHSFLPVEATQPDGSRINIYASGDEFHNWLHDENNYTIVKDESGAYVYAMQERGSLVPSDLLVGRDSPSMRNITPGLNLSREEIKAKYDRYADMRDYSNARAPHSGQLNNIVIFVKFSDSPNFSTPFSTYQQIFNSTTDNSMKRYFQAASYNQLTINSHFYPAPSGNTVVCYTDTYPRSFFQPYDASNNPNGYSGHDQRTEREQQMLKRAVEGVRSGIPTSLNIDGDNDGYVDNVCFIIQGATDGWSDLLWPHKWALYTVDARINGKRVWEFNFQLENSLDYSGASVLSHEMFHSLGAPDLYRYYDRTITPIGSWDLMAANLNPPQHMGAWMKHRYGQWISNVPTITTSGTYTLSPVASSSTNNIYRINSWKADEYYVLEYRKSDGTYDGNLPGTGLLVYRLDTDEEGNAQGPPDELYIYRPGGTNSVDGNLNQAHFSAQTGRTELSEATTPNGFLGDGSAGGLNLFDVGSAGNTITFKVKISDIQLTYPHGGEVWQSGDNRVITWKSKAYTGSVKLEYSSNGGQSWTQIATNVSNSGSYTWYGVPSMNNSTNVHIRISLLGTSHSDSNYYPFTVSGTSWNPPRNLSAIPRNGYVTLNWQAPISGTPTSYRIYRNGSLLNTVTALTYTDNAVVNETTYSYYVTAVYSDGVSEPSNTVQATPTANVPTSVILGSGTDSNGNSTACPVNVYYKSLHGQSVYTKAELNAAGVFGPINITGLGFNITGLPTQAMPNYVVRMGHTNATNVSDWIATGLTQVWRRSSFQPTATGWNMFVLPTPFEWNGVDNIVVDTAFGMTSSWSSSGTTQYTNVTDGYRFKRSDYTNQTDIFSDGDPSNYRPNLRLTLRELGNPTISIDDNTLYANLQVDTEGTDSFTITNSGNAPLTYDIGMEELTPRGSPRTAVKASDQDRNIAGSTLTLNATDYLPGSTVNWTFTVTNGSSDYEWLTDVTISFPAGVTVNSATNFVGGDGGPLTPDVTSGNGVTIIWHGEDSNGWGFIEGGEFAMATVNVTIAPSFSGDLSLLWSIGGDGYNNVPPHTLSGSIVLTQDLPPVPWLTVQPLSGSIAAGESVTVTANFSAVGMAVGNYAALLTIQSNDSVNPSLNVNANMDVWDGLPTPVITAITKINGGFRINWNAVPTATAYEIWRATDPYGTYTRIGSNISGTTYNDLTNLPKAFYRVKAIRN